MPDDMWVRDVGKIDDVRLTDGAIVAQFPLFGGHLAVAKDRLFGVAGNTVIAWPLDGKGSSSSVAKLSARPYALCGVRGKILIFCSDLTVFEWTGVGEAKKVTADIDNMLVNRVLAPPATAVPTEELKKIVELEQKLPEELVGQIHNYIGDRHFVDQRDEADWLLAQYRFALANGKWTPPTTLPVGLQ